MTGLSGRLTRRYWAGKKGRTLITLLGIALGVTMVVAVTLTNRSMLGNYESLITAAAGRAELQVTPATGTGFPEALLAEAGAVPGVQATVPAVTSGAPVVAHDRQAGATLYGVDPTLEAQVREYRFTAGGMPGAAGPAHEAAISADLADALSLAVGDSFSVLTTSGMQNLTVTGIFDAAGTVRGYLGPFALVPLPTAQGFFSREGKLDLIDIRLAETASTGPVAERIRDRLGDGIQVGRPAERTREMQRMLDSIGFLLSMVGSLALFAGGFIIYTNVAMGIAERRREIAVLRALGMRRGEVLRMVLTETAVLGLIGSLLGLLWGFGLAAAMAQQMTAQFLAVFLLQTSRVTLDPATILTALAAGTGAALVAALGPALESVRVGPVEAMRQEGGAGESEERPGWQPVAAGLLLIAGGAAFVALTWPTEGMLPGWMLRLWGVSVAFILLGVVLLLPALLVRAERGLLRPLLTALLGVSGRIAAGNLVRRPRRTAATLAALLVTLTFMVAIGGISASQDAAFNQWYNKTVGWDIHVSTSFAGLGAQVEMSPEFEQELAGVEGVRVVSYQKFARVYLPDGFMLSLQAFDMSNLREYSDLSMEQGDLDDAVAAMEQGGAVLISPALSRRLSITIGDSIGLPTPEGEVQFRVAGIATDVSPWGGTVHISRKDYATYWHDRTATAFAILVADGVDPAAVRTRIVDRWGESRHLRVRLNREFWTEMEASYQGFYQMMDGLILIAILVSGLAIANTLFAAILERRRELSILRALGTRRGEVIRLILGEALGLGLVGALIGIPVGAALQEVMLRSMAVINGVDVVIALSWSSIFAALAVALFIAPVSGILPARYAIGLDVVDGLRYE